MKKINKQVLVIAKALGGILTLSVSFAPATAFGDSKSSPSTLLYQDVNASTLEYQSMLKAHADWVSPTQAFGLNSLPTRRLRNRLYERFLEAQRAFLEEDLAHARDVFSSLLAQATQAEWGPTERELFVFSGLRLAQLEPQLTTQHLLTASTFHDQTRQPIRLPQAVFSPKLQATYAQILTQTLEAQFKASVWRSWDFILINGQPCTRLKCIKVHPDATNLRLTFVSNRYKPKTVFVSASDFSNVEPPLQPFVGGSCTEPLLDTLVVPKNYKHQAFFSLDCVHNPVNLSPTLAGPASTPDPVANFHQSMAKKTLEKTPWIKNKWLWLGIGSGTALFIVYHSQAKSRRPSSSDTTYGY